MERLAVCPGSFDPVTCGHIDVISRTAAIFDKVIVVVMYNYHKLNQMTFTPEERVDMIRRCTGNMPNVAVDFYGGLLADYVKMNKATAIVKGLRAVTDFEDEFQQALTNKLLAPGVETVEPGDVELGQSFCGIELAIPVLASAMDAVVDPAFAGHLAAQPALL
ncbi:MAG: pantetheine-phosphate adenylyltransferase, partial [Clostridia bacterium]|nr:pantetheine-phosphate adenylyltransferase [Clostridia bacterium]